MNLTPREIEILQLMAHGKTMRDVAELSHRSFRTVECQVQEARRKTGAESTIHLVAMAMREGVIK